MGKGEGKGEGKGDGKKQFKNQLRDEKRSQIEENEKKLLEADGMNLDDISKIVSSNEDKKKETIEVIEEKKKFDTDVVSSEHLGSLTYPMQASSLRKGHYIIIKGEPCKVINMTVHKTGKHGHAKIHFTAVNIFSGKKLEMLESSTHNVESPIVKRSEYTLVNIDTEGFCSFLLEDGSLKEDLRIPNNEIGLKLKTSFQEKGELIVCVMNAMNHEQIMEFKPLNQ